VSPVDDYIRSFPEPTRQALQQIRDTIRRVAPTAKEKISYAMPAYMLHGKPLIYFAGYPHHVGLYALPVTHAKFASLLSTYKQGKGSVQFPLDRPMPLLLVASMIAFRVEELTSRT